MAFFDHFEFFSVFLWYSLYISAAKNAESFIDKKAEKVKKWNFSEISSYGTLTKPIGISYKKWKHDLFHDFSIAYLCAEVPNSKYANFEILTLVNYWKCKTFVAWNFKKY